MPARGERLGGRASCGNLNDHGDTCRDHKRREADKEHRSGGVGGVAAASFKFLTAHFELSGRDEGALDRHFEQLT